ncbi:MAG: DUF819 family protein [bacterium]|nr:DUF819 family protein [bacterium]
MKTPLILALYILFPALVIYLCYKFPIINKISAVLLCYLGGMIIGNIGIFPEGFDKVQETASGVAVVLALPMLLFSLDVKKWSRLAGKTLLSMALATVSIILIATTLFFIFKAVITDSWQLSGMAVGLYTGGTPNLAAIQKALDVESSRYIIFHTYDTIVSLVFIIFCVTIAQRVFLTYLPAFRNNNSADNTDTADNDGKSEDIQLYQGIFTPKKLLPVIGTFFISAGIVGLSVFVSEKISKENANSITILLITTLGIGFSFIRPIRNIDKTFQAGMYIIYVFCFIVGSMVNYKVLVNINYNILVFVIIGIFGTMLLHSLFCKIFKVDADTFIITSTSAICSPPFVPVVAGALKNKEMLLSGITTGIIGYAIGNYLGISLGLLLK